MITSNEIEATKLSVTKKDYYQVWNELLETATKLSERWSPESTNESDPGIVLLKTLTAIADKLNYNIDKNTLETMMPSAAQEESIRKLCSMMGYNVKYYQSATTEVSITYTGGKDEQGNLLDSNGEIIEKLDLPLFTSITNKDNDITYITIEPETFAQNKSSVKVTCMEGQLIQCETDNNNTISMSLIDDNYRYYLPEAYVAENGIFVYNLDGGGDTESTARYTEQWQQVDNLNTQSMKTKCYKFGFDSVKGLPYLQFPEDIGSLIADGLLVYYIRTSGAQGNISAFTLSKITKFWSDDAKIAEEYFTVSNNSAATNGANIETINKAYNNYKKTVGTFDTLVTCRDYMNKIYQLVSEEDNTTPLVSNCNVADIKDDLNNAVNICTFSDYGLCYVNRPVYSGTTEKISHFDLILYPYKNYVSNGTATNYKDSFNYSTAKWLEILNGLEKNKTISHNFKVPESTDLVGIKVYYKLNARITTAYELTKAGEASLRNIICAALYDAFNMRELEFGEKITPDEVLECIQKSDNRIKNVFLDTPDMYVKIQRTDKELSETESADDFHKAYIHLAAKNILSGRIPLFTYNTNFKPEYTETAYDSVVKPEYPFDNRKIKALCPCFEFKPDTPLTLGPNEVIQFRAPSYHTTLTYPAYVNYFLHLEEGSGDQAAIPAVFTSLSTFMTNALWAEFVNGDKYKAGMSEGKKFDTQADFNTAKNKYKKLFIKNSENFTIEESYESSKTYYYFAYDEDHFSYWKEFIKSKKIGEQELDIYRILNKYYTNTPGYLVDANHNKFQLCTIYMAAAGTSMLDSQYVPNELGKNAVNSTIRANQEYTLKPNEYLLINYTKSSTDENSTGTIVNEELAAGTIIKPNFELIDSKKRKEAGQNYSKESGYGPWKSHKAEDIPGMYTLDANEQIEIRSKTVVKLGSETVKTGINLYWTKAEMQEIKDSGGIGTGIFERKPFVFKNDTEWELAENEYICYTDLDKVSMAYYGSGTVLKNNAGRDLELSSETKELSLAEIATKGINGITWSTFWLDPTQTVDITEYQYISLTEGDRLDKLTVNAEIIKTGEYKGVTDAEFTYSDGSAGSLPILSTDWEVTAKLNINAGPSLPQKLRVNGTQSETGYYKDSITIDYLTGNSDTIAPVSADKPLSIKLSSLIQSGATKIDTISYLYNDDEKTLSIDNDYDLKLKTFLEKECTYGTKSTPVAFHNSWETLTSITTDNMEEGNPTININISEGNFGLAMFYVTINDDKGWKLTPNTEAILGIYNNISGSSIGRNGKWWSGYDAGVLRAGLNLVCIPHACTSITISKLDTKLKSSLVFSDLDIVKASDITTAAEYHGINYKLLGLVKEGTRDDIAAMLEELCALDHSKEFYYNCPIESKSAININYVDGIIEETLLQPKAWFDYNNINNKFVISELDTSHLKSGITFGNLWKR